MEEFRKKLKKRLKIFWALIIVFTISYVLLLIFGSDKGYNGGFFTGIITVSIMNLVRTKKSLKDEKKFKEQYIRENDERLGTIEKEVTKTTFNVTLVVLSLAVIVSNYFNIIVSCTLACVLGIISAIYLGSLIYYNKKM
ncbi:MAG: hypothetical protein IJM38_08950 [Ruminococcus sp.]|nr:hypothetical protein [Ruminococcus sp.]